VGVSAISCWEVAFLVIRGRLRLDRDVAAWVNAALRRPRTELLPLDPVIAVDAAHLSAFGGDPADHIIVATVRHHGAKLATADAAIASSGLVDVIWR
jgi:PIN domain nuclease of toxin-antitoxin system